MYDKIREYLRLAARAQQQTGKSIHRQAWEMLQLTRSPNNIGPGEYFDFRLYDDDLYTDAERRQFLGYKAYRHYRKLNHGSWEGAANDKLLFHALMYTAGFSIPEIYGVVSRCGRQFREARVIREESELHHFLTANKRLLPFFYKPVHGFFGEGAGVIRDYEPDTQMVTTENGNPTVSELFESFVPSMEKGVFLQNVLRPSSTMESLVGPRLASTRFIVLLRDGEAEIIAVNWKIPVGDNIVTNTHGWTNGNMAASADSETGELLRVCEAGEKGPREYFGSHPQTGVGLKGAVIPDFDNQRDYVLAAARQLPGVRLQGWDVVSTDKGIAALEVNLVSQSTVHTCQVVGRKGLLTDVLRSEMGGPGQKGRRARAGSV